MQTGPQNDTKIDVIYVKSRFRLVKGPPGTHWDYRRRMLHVGRFFDQKWKGRPGGGPIDTCSAAADLGALYTEGIDT